jgi:hypothetical protein
MKNKTPTRNASGADRTMPATRKTLLSTALAALLIGAALPSGANATVLNFDDLSSYLGTVPEGYGGLNWNYGFSSLDETYGFFGAVSGPNFAMGGFTGAAPQMISGGPFDFNGMYLTSYQSSALLSVSGSANGITLYSQSVWIDTSPAWFQFDYFGIDTLTFNVYMPGGGYNFFGLDDFTFNEVIGAIGSIADWTDSTLDLLIGPGGFLGPNVTLQENENLAEHDLTIAPSGRFTQNGGTHTVNGSMHNGGSYKLNGGSLTVAGDETIDNGYGYGSSTGFDQSGGTHNVAGTLTLGKQSNNSGSYNLIDGVLSALNEVIGDAGYGTFNQYAGTNTVGDTLTLGKEASGSGSYNLYGGALNTGNTVVGDGGYGSFRQTGGTHTVAQTLTLGKQASGYGSYQLEKGELNTGDVIIGDAGRGSFSQGYGYPFIDYPIHRVSGTLTLGRQAGSSGDYSMATGLLSAKDVVIGDAGTGYFAQYGGTHEAETLTLGKQASGRGTYDQVFGDLNVGDIVVGDAGVGTFNLGDTLYAGIYGYTPKNTVNGTLTLGKQAGSLGIYNLTRGILTARNTVIGDAGTGTFRQTDGEHHVAETLTLGKQVGASGTYDLVTGGVTAADEVIGDAGVGRFTQGNDLNVGDRSRNYVQGTLTLGKQGGSRGVYELFAGIVTSQNTVVGDAGVGYFEQYGGEHHVASTLTLGKQASGKGVYGLYMGELTAAEEVIGDAGVGTFSQGESRYGYSTSNTVQGALTLGKQAGGNGVYNLVAGALSAAKEVIGDAGIGVFEQSGGTNTVAEALTLGKQAGGDGTYKLSSGALVAANEIVGDAGTGTFTQGEGNYGYSSSNTVNGTLTLGKQAGGNGVYNLIAGALATKGTEVGDAGTGTLNQLGGTNTVDGDLTLGKQAEGSGAYNLTAGQLTTAKTIVGDAGYGVFTQSGGAHATQALTLGGQDSGYGNYNLLNGTLTSTSTTVGDAGVGVFTQAGGKHTVANLTLGKQAGSEGTYNLRGGNLYVTGNIANGAGQGAMLISGGALNFGAGAHDVDVDTLKVSGQGAIKLTDAATVTFQKAVVHNGKEINLATGTNAIFNGAFSGKGPFTGGGTATFNSVLNTGDGPITFNVAGNMVLGEHSKSIMQVGGTARGTGYDAVDVGGALTLDGELNLVGLNGFNAQLGDVFDLYKAETIWGQFDLLTLFVLGDGLAWKIDYLIDAIGTTDIVRVSVVSSVPLPASVWLLQSALFGLFAARRYGRKNR